MKLKLTQIKSIIRRTEDQAATLRALGLKKMHSTSIVEDTPSIRGMIFKVKHLVKVESVK